MTAGPPDTAASPTTPRLGRRRLLWGAGGALAAGLAAPVAARPAPAVARASGTQVAGLPADKDPRDLVAYGYAPLEAEARREALVDPVTPTARMFLRQNLPLPDPAILDDRDAWPVRVDGVAAPSDLTLGELRALGGTDVTALIQCSGNGRGFAAHGPAGSPWRVGALGNPRWTGVPVRVVVDALGGAAPGARFLTATGVGEPIPADRDPLDHVVERSVPLAKGLADCLLAWEMNGEPIPLEHGGPLRLIVPGYWGINHVKFVGRIGLTAQESAARIQRSTYRVRPVGVASDPAQPTMWEMNVKSLITSPTDAADPAAGRLEVRGFAWAGEQPVAGVEVSTDGGRTWHPATLDGDAGPASWRGFRYAFTAVPGEYRLVSRATDTAGRTQPEFPEPNERGYGHNGWRHPAVTVEVV